MKSPRYEDFPGRAVRPGDMVLAILNVPAGAAFYYGEVAGISESEVEIADIDGRFPVESTRFFVTQASAYSAWDALEVDK